MINDKEIHLIPEGRPNHWLDAVELAAGREHVYVLREGQSPEEFWAELEAGEVRERHGLAPGRTMPTAEEIAAGPVPPAPDPRDVEIADLKADVAALKKAGVLTDAMIDAAKGGAIDAKAIGAAPSRKA